MKKYLYIILIIFSWLACNDAHQSEHNVTGQNRPKLELLGQGLEPSVLKFIIDYPIPEKKKEKIIKELKDIVKKPFSTVAERESAIENMVKSHDVDEEFVNDLNININKSYPLSPPALPPIKPTKKKKPFVPVVKVGPPKTPTKPVVPKKAPAVIPKKMGLPGFSKMRNTCFANASLNSLFFSSLMQGIVDKPLDRNDSETEQKFQAKEALRQSLSKLFEARKKNDKLCDHLNKVFDTFEQSRNVVLGSELVGYNEKIRQDQADAQEFLNDIFIMLDVKSPQFYYHIFRDDNRVRIFDELDPFIRIPLGDFTNISFAQRYDDSRLPKAMVGDDQAENADGQKADSDRYNVVADPPPSSLFIALNRFTSEEKKDVWIKRKLSNPITPSKDLKVTATDRNDVAKTKDYEYYLRVIIIHHGSVDGGHYYAYVYSANDKKWVWYNDNIVNEVSENHVMKDAERDGYIFMYERKE